MVALGLFALGPSAPARAATVADPAALVNPFIGTLNLADDFPGADSPFGMVQWSPDTPSRPDGGGYAYSDSSITGFSLTHISGPGCGGAGDVPILPTVGAVSTSATDSFSHSNESASPGYYSVGLGNGVHTELTTTTRTGMARFTFPATTQANLIFKLNGSQNGDSATSWNVVNNTEVSGSVTSGHFCGAGFTYTMFFDIVFDQPFAFISLKPEELPLSMAIQGYWTRFASAGDPNAAAPSGTATWPRYDAMRDISLSLDLTIGTDTALRKPACDFWDSL